MVVVQNWPNCKFDRLHVQRILNLGLKLPEHQLPIILKMLCLNQYLTTITLALPGKSNQKCNGRWNVIEDFWPHIQKLYNTTLSRYIIHDFIKHKVRGFCDRMINFATVKINRGHKRSVNTWKIMIKHTSNRELV